MACRGVEASRLVHLLLYLKVVVSCDSIAGIITFTDDVKVYTMLRYLLMLGECIASEIFIVQIYLHR